MKSIALIHISLIALGIIFGAFSNIVEPIELAPFTIASAMFIRSLIASVIVLGFLAVVARSWFQYGFWHCYLCCVFAIAAGFGMTTQSLPDSMALIGGAFGWLLGLPISARVHKWRFHEAP